MVIPNLLTLKKKAIVILGITVIFICGFIGIFLINLQLRKSNADLMKKSEEEYKLQLSQAREMIQKDFEDKYNTNTVSFKALVKGLELEHKYTQEIEEKLRQVEKNKKSSKIK